MSPARVLGSSGISVRPIGLGGMPMSIQGRPTREQSLDTLRAAFEAGIDFVDTADVYCLDDDDIGHNERLIAEGIRLFGAGRHITVATKGGCVRPNGAWGVDGRPSHLKQACDRSLVALGVDRITLYQLHAPDGRVKLEDSVGALAELRAAGKIAHVGLSNVSVDQLDRAERIVPIVSVQNRLNPYDTRALTDGVLAACQRRGIAFLPYSPVGGSRGIARLRADPALAALATRHQATAPQVALAWLLARSPAMIPIPGASKPENARSSAQAMDLVLAREEIAALDKTFLGRA
jgi:aryl-alcohol dehydrogenase-like predicted oxidoreductase